MNILLSSDIKDIKEVLEVNYKIENDKILFVAKLSMVYDDNYREYRIGKYCINDSYGNIITEKGIKEYVNLKSLCKATDIFKPKTTFWYDRVVKYYRENKNKEVS